MRRYKIPGKNHNILSAKLITHLSILVKLPAPIVISIAILLTCLPLISGCGSSTAQTGTQSKVVLALFDISNSTSSDRGQYLKDFRKVLDGLNPGDVIVAERIDSNSLSDSTFPINETIKQLKSDPNENQIKAYTKQRDLPKRVKQQKDAILAQVKTLLEKNSEATEMFGAFKVAQRVFDTYQDKKRVLIVFSDMYHQPGEAAGYDFTNPSFNEKSIPVLIKHEKSEGVLPNLSGVTVYVSGAKANTISKAMLVQKFWQAFFKEAGATLPEKNYGRSLLAFDE
ncbi:MAG TPA: hypothetical protein VGK02_07680 [Candidatus Aquicultor sp.]|jgi:hypothetical protein